MAEIVRLDEAILVDRLPLRSRARYEMTVEGGAESVPLHAVVGAQRRPCLALMAGVHGNEYDGIMTLMELSREVASWPLQGSLIVIPVANPFAFARAQRRTPHDNQDLNRVFPGSPRGTLSERLAARLCFEVLRDADLVFTLHGSTSDGLLAPWIEFLEGTTGLERATHDAAVASGFEDLTALPRLPGTLQTAMAELDVPVIEGEVGGRGATTREDVVYYKDRVVSVACHVGVLFRDQPSTRPANGRTWHLRGIEADVGGAFLRAVELRQEVHAGDVLGTILDIHGDVVVEVRSPVDAMVGGYRVHTGVLRGDRLVTLWCPLERNGQIARSLGEGAARAS